MSAAAAGSLEFAPAGSAEFAARAVALARGARRAMVFHPWSEGMRALAQHVSASVPGAPLRVLQGQAADAGPPPAEWAEADAVVLDCEPQALAARLLEFVDRPDLRVLAPRTGGHFSERPLYLISIPKSGSHLLYRLAELLGYAAGIVGGEFPRPGHWYFVEHYQSHTGARDFLMDSSFRRAPWSNSHHPFASSPALFIYRHPLDILVSEANYFHRDEKSIFAGYLAGLALEQRIDRLLEDAWLLGSLRERVGAYIPWLEFPNVVPLAFEELVGDPGGGSDEEQLRAVWSVQLKLQAPGEPKAIASRLFDRASPTFFQGRVGAWRSTLSAQHLARVQGLNQDFMQAFGYRLDAPPGALPARSAEFRRRPLRVHPPLLDKEGIALEYNYLGFNLVRFDGWIYAVPQAAGPQFEVSRQRPERLRLLPRGRSIAAVKHRIWVRSLWWGGNTEALADYVAARVSRAGVWGRALPALARTTLRHALRRDSQ